MKKGIINLKCASPKIQLGNPIFNGELIKAEIENCENEGVSVLALPELCLCGTSLGDMLSHNVILNSCEKALKNLLNQTQGSSVLTIVGLPYQIFDKVYNIGVIIEGGKILGAVYSNSLSKKSPLGHYRVFSDCYDTEIDILGNKVTLSRYFQAEKNGVCVGFILGCDEIVIENTPDLIVNPTSLFETVESERIIESYAKDISKRLNCAYAICTPSVNESTSNVIFSSYSLISVNGEILGVCPPFSKKTVGCVSVNSQNSKKTEGKIDSYNSYASLLYSNKNVGKNPFVPDNIDELDYRCKKILDMESNALARRLTASYSKCAVLGISGGLDSTLALITCVLCADILNWDRKNIVCVTMPCFGTTNRTKNNARDLCNALGVTIKEVNIKEAVTVHLRDINHDIENRNVAYENAQARERTQVLMDIANDLGGIVVGTGDMSEVALGWSTYNGDHMSMYGVNSAIVKTLVRHIVAYYAKNSQQCVANILNDILDTPVSPELLPHKDGEIQQKTEDIVGPYELHDYFIYYFCAKGLMPSEIYAYAKKDYGDRYNDETIYKWLEIFIKRFFSQHFKRSCSPDSIRLGSASLGKYDLQMPSDMSCEPFLADLRSVK